MGTLIETNAYQTPVTDEWLSQFPGEVRDQFMELMDTVPMLKWMAGPDRPRARDLPRDRKGRIVVDITRPHILEDMDYFRPAALFHKENGCYTLLRPNSNRSSEYGKWLTEEMRRCRDGYVRESDGEWVTGPMYFFLNYSPIMLNRWSDDAGVYLRVRDLPDFWEAIYYRFHYLDQARLHGKHCMELSRRGSSKSFSLASFMARNLILGENSVACKDVTTILTAYSKEYLSEKDGTLTKFSPIVDWCAEETDFPRLMLRRSPTDMVWRMGYKNANKNEGGSLNSVMGLSVQEDEGKIRGKRGFILFEEMGSYPSFKDVWDNVRDSVKEGSHVFSELYAVGTAGDDASDFAGVRTMLYNPDAYEVYALPNVYDIKGKGSSKFALFTPSYISRAGCMDKDGNSDVTKALMEILMERYAVKQGGDSASYMKRVAQMPVTPAEAILKVQSNFFPVTMLGERLRQLDSDPRAYDDVYVGELVETAAGTVEFRATDAVPIHEWPVDNSERGALEIFSMPPKGEIPEGRYCAGCLTPGQQVCTDSGLKSVEDVTLDDMLLNKDGQYVRIVNLQRRHVEAEPVYSFKLVDTIDRIELTGNHPVYVATPEKHYHKWSVHLATGEPASYYKYDFEFRRADQIKAGDVVKSPVPYFDEKPVPYELWKRPVRKGLKYIANPLGKWKFWWLVGLVLGDGWCNGKSVYVSFNAREGQYVRRFKNVASAIFGRSPILCKDRGTCLEYCFGSVQFCDFFTEWFGKYALNKHIPEWVKFLPKPLRLALVTGYLDSDGCCCKNSMEFVSISKHLLVDIQDILLSIGIVSGIKCLRGEKIHTFRSDDGKEYRSRTKVTYSLAVARAGVERISSLLGRKDLKLKNFDYRETANHAIKRCWLSDDGRYVYYKIMGIDIRSYTGVVYNFECDTHSYMCGHLPVHNCDPVDNDQAESQSLMSVFVLDLFTDTIAAEYTGRMPFAEDGYEVARLLCVFYNARLLYESNLKGTFQYFAKKRCTWMLADCPEYLRDRQLVKYSTFGSSQKGVTVNSAIIGYANGLIRDWLCRTYPMEVKDADGKVHTEDVPNLYRLRNRALIQELIGYGPGVNTDRVRALSQAMLYREQYMILYGGPPQEASGTSDDPADDEFFDRDWNRRLRSLGRDPYDGGGGKRNGLQW